MASSPSSLPGRRNRPGCMSGIAHLFDFNQALAGKKLLADKEDATGTESRGNNLDDDVEQSLSETGDSIGKIEFSKRASVSGRSGNVPIKALIANDVSQDFGIADEPRSRAPSVVARLMGLEALPCDRDGQIRQTGELENLDQELHSDRLQHGRLPSFSSSKVFKTGKPPTRSLSDLSSCGRYGLQEHTPSFGSLSTGSHFQEQEFKLVLDQQTGSNFENRVQIQNLDDLDVQLAAKQMLIKKKLNEAKLGLLAKNKCPQEKTCESRDLMDAMDFLQANKDFFARFLEEPDSSYAQHLRSSNHKFTRGKLEELVKHSKRHTAGPPEHGNAAQIKVPPALWRSQYRESEKSHQIDDRVSTDNSFQREKRSKTQQKHAKHSQYMVSNTDDCRQAPTKIVVLKPGLGKVRNLRSLRQSSPKSSEEFLEAMEENGMVALQDLRCKLQQEDAIDLKKTLTSANELSKLKRDPREIAREIARQVRENVVRDMASKAKGFVVCETGWDRNKVQTEVLLDESGINMNHKGSRIVKPRDPTREMMPNFSNHLLYKRTSGNRGKGDSRKGLEQSFLEKSVAQSLSPHDAASRRHPCLGDCGCCHRQGCQRVGGLEVDEMNSSNTSKIHSASETDIDCETGSQSQSVCESDADYVPCVTLLRSMSVPASDSYHKRLEKKGVIYNYTPLACEANISNIMRQLGAFRLSVFRGKRLGTNSVLSKGNAFVEGSEKTFIPMQERPMQDFNSNAGPTHEKVQKHQIDDTGLVLNSDLSVSSPDEYLTSEANLMTEGTANGKLPGRATFTQTINGNTMLTKAKSLSPEESPSKSLSSTDVDPMSTDCEVSKDLPDQPSPVSVLDAPFHEEPASPMDFTEIDSALQGLGARLQLLKLADREAEAVSIQEEYHEADSELTDKKQPATAHLHNVSSNSEAINLLVDEIMSHKGETHELLYVQRLLIVSGFTMDIATVLTRWHSPSHPLAKRVFELVENEYRCECKDTRMKKCGLNFLTRQLLFDSVNEVLHQALGPYLDCRTWLKCSQLPSRMPLGEELVGQVCSAIYKLLCLQSEHQDSPLGSLVAEDIATKAEWQDFSLDLEIVMLGVEKAIWNDILEETLCSH